MLSVIAKLLEQFLNPIFTGLGGRVVKGREVCRQLFRLHIAVEDLVSAAVGAYDSLEQWVEADEATRRDPDFREKTRWEVGQLLFALHRFEDVLRRLSAKLGLIDEDQDTFIRLVEVPESSYTLFKRHFVEDLAPKFVADRRGARYVLRVAAETSDETRLVNVDRLGKVSIDLERLFKEGALHYELIDLDRTDEVAAVLKACSAELAMLGKAGDALRDLIRANCKVQEVL